jgi:hypothetical protein
MKTVQRRSFIVGVPFVLNYGNGPIARRLVSDFHLAKETVPSTEGAGMGAVVTRY